MRGNKWAVAVGVLALVSGAAWASEPTGTGSELEAQGRGAIVLPGTARPFGRSMAEWSTRWYAWHFGVPAAQNPALALEADCDVAQDEAVYFVPMYDFATTYARSCRVPFGKPVFVPLWVIINDYPCPDPAFEPAPGQTLEQFLREGVQAFNAGLQGLSVTVDGRPVDVVRHRHTSGLFTFTGEPSLVGHIPDACLLGGVPQQAVVDGWSLMLLLAPGEHEVRVQAPQTPIGAPVDFTYRLHVER
jgi:hypothetical protein